MFSVKKILRTLPYLLSSCVNRWGDIGIQVQVATAGCRRQLTFHDLNSELDKADSGDTGTEFAFNPKSRQSAHWFTATANSDEIASKMD